MTVANTLTAEEARHRLWDAIVIGAGPAGSLTAGLMARDGYRVLLIERKTLPRYKVCGGCVSPEGVALLESLTNGQVWQELCKHELTSFQLRAAQHVLTLSLPGGVAVPRADLDAWLTQKAIRWGADFLADTVARVAESDDDTRSVNIESSASATSCTLRAKVVIAADGLGHPSLRKLHTFREDVARNSYLGVGCEVSRIWPDIDGQTVYMSVGKQGYVGIVRFHEHAVNLAAALAPQFIHGAGGVGLAVVRTLHEAGMKPPAGLADEPWTGTPLLTRRTHPSATCRLFTIGDAASYVEPFTGEGITWALTSAVQAVAPLRRAIDRWDESVVAEWNRYQQQMSGRQRSCRALTGLLRNPWLLTTAICAGNLFPNLARPVAQWFQRSSPMPVRAGPRTTCN